MAIKKQNKRSLEEAKSAPSQNGGEKKKSQKFAKKVKLEKDAPVQNNGVPEQKLQKANKPIVKVEAVKGAKVKKEIKAPTAEAIAAKIEKKKLKNAAKHAKKKENRKEARKEGGQYKPEKIQMNAEQIQLRIDAITSRPELTKTAKRRLVALRKRLQVAQGTYVPKPKPDPVDSALTKSQKQHKKKLQQKARKLANKELTEKKNVSEEDTTGVVAKPAAASTKQKAIVAALHPVAKKEKLAKGAKQQQQQPKGQQSKKLVIKKEEPEDEEEDDDDEDAEDEEDSNEEVDSSAASFMNTTAEDSEDDDDDEVEEDDDDEDEDDDDEDDEEEVKLPVKKIKQEPATKVKQETEKKPFAKKADAKTPGKNGPATNGDSEDGKKKRFVLFVGNLSYESTAEDIKKHFLTKVGDVSSVRVPTKPGTNSPRGFAYVEVTNDTDYEKGLSLHNTQLNGRRLNVEYTRGGSKSVGNRSDIVSKNKKLHAMRKQGMLAGSQKDGHKRNDRRQKARQQGPA